MNYFSDSPEWKHHFRHSIDWDTILPLYYPTFPTANGFQNKEELLEFFEQILDTTGAWAGGSVRGRARELDETGSATLNGDGSVTVSAPLQKTYDEARGMEFFKTCVDEKFGGLGLPWSVGAFAFQQTAHACMATSTQLAFFASIADMIDRFCDDETRSRLVPLIASGDISGSMCLTEPDAGSDVGALRTSAEKQADGSYHLNGSKIFITNAGGGLGLVLARVKGAPEGLSGISIFLAMEKFDGKQNYKIAKIEEKMGMHGSMTCEVVYENTKAHLVGEENQGFKIMLHLMNEARISVGLQSIGGIEAALDEAKAYSAERKQFGKPIAELPLMKRNLKDWEVEQDAFRAFMADTISQFDVFQKIDLKERHESIDESERKLMNRALEIIRARTPLVKYTGSELYHTLSTKAIQAYGGYGYMQEYDVERIHRDCFGALLYEGTSQIQALMAMKDYVKKIMKNPSQFLRDVMAPQTLNTLTERNEFKKIYINFKSDFERNFASLILACFKPGGTVLETLAQLDKLFSREYWQDSEKLEKLMIHAETLCQGLTILEILKVLGRHTTKEPTRAKLFHDYLILAQPRLLAIYRDWEIR